MMSVTQKTGAENRLLEIIIPTGGSSGVWMQEL